MESTVPPAPVDMLCGEALPKTETKAKKAKRPKKLDFVGEYLSAVINDGGIHELNSNDLQRHYNTFAKMQHRARFRANELYAIIRLVLDIPPCQLDAAIEDFRNAREWVLPLDLDGIRQRLIAKGMYNSEIKLSM